MLKIFISYRRADSHKDAGRIYDRLVDAFGKDNVFKDVDSIPLGKDFRGILREAVAQCDVQLTIIGGKWLDIKGVDGQQRLDHAEDFVRIEMESALQRDSGLAILVMVDNVTMPNTSELPDVLRELALLGNDTRSGVGLNTDGLPDINWVEIPAGDFLYQEEDTPRNLPAFEISAYPVTHTQFQAFIDASDGYENKKIDWFEGFAIEEHHKRIREQSFQYGNHPRECVSWYQALAFCRWLSYKLSGCYDLKAIDKWVVRLPTEMEWEKAARYPDGRQYVWGNEYQTGMANINETYGDAGTYNLEITSVVGLYPASPLGLYDLNGNMWEWCLSDYEYPAAHPHGEDLGILITRVLRGGSWSFSSNFARSTYRYSHDPSNNPRSIGFRLFRPIG